MTSQITWLQWPSHAVISFLQWFESPTIEPVRVSCYRFKKCIANFSSFFLSVGLISGGEVSQVTSRHRFRICRTKVTSFFTNPEQGKAGGGVFVFLRTSLSLVSFIAVELVGPSTSVPE